MTVTLNPKGFGASGFDFAACKRHLLASSWGLVVFQVSRWVSGLRVSGLGLGRYG